MFYCREINECSWLDHPCQARSGLVLPVSELNRWAVFVWISDDPPVTWREAPLKHWIRLFAKMTNPHFKEPSHDTTSSTHDRRYAAAESDTCNSKKLYPPGSRSGTILPA